MYNLKNFIYSFRIRLRYYHTILITMQMSVNSNLRGCVKKGRRSNEKEADGDENTSEHRDILGFDGGPVAEPAPSRC